MRVAIVVIAGILIVIFIGGAVNLGKAPLFGHIDSVLKTTVLMDLHYTVFSMIYRGERAVGAGFEKTTADIDDLQRKAEFGKKQKYQRLDKESHY
jgi:hypothetical protein